MTDQNWELIHADCVDAMRKMPASSIDAIVTDPPYGLDFVDGKWDKSTPSTRIAEEMLRLAKPGAHMLIFGSPRTYHRLACAIEDAGWEIRDCIMWVYGTGFHRSKNLGGDWAGWGTALKPSFEPILLARKPLLYRSVEKNVEAFGTGALNIKGCSIDSGDEKVYVFGYIKDQNYKSSTYNMQHTRRMRIGYATNYKRRPPNIILDEEAAEIIDEQAKTFKDIKMPPSRLFYIPRAGRKEKTLDGRVMNDHPTVKPLTLMQWLVRLITPPGGVVLDPFCGSGTTGVAALREGFSFIGIEIEERYVEIAKERIMIDGEWQKKRD